MPICANLETYEGTLGGGDNTFTFYGRPRRLILTNDSASTEIKYRFHETGDEATLKPTETITLEHFVVGQVIMTGAGAEYRIWGFR